MAGKIKNLLFDLGGVIMDLKRERCVEAFKAIGLAIADEMLGLYVQAGPFRALEEGSLSDADFRNAIREHLTADVSDREIDDAFNRFLVGIPVHRLQSLRRLRERYKIYLLSNTNSIMWNSKIKECFRIEGREMPEYFDGMVTSFEARCVKPDPEIFEYTLAHLGIKAEETLFMDDSQKNLDAAARFGFATGLVPPGTEFVDVIEDKTK